MQTFICKTKECGHVIQTRHSQPHELTLNAVACPKCKKLAWDIYRGPIAPTILAAEDAKEKTLKPQVETARIERDRCELAMQAAESAHKKLQFRWEQKKQVDNGEGAQMLDALTKANAAWVAATEAFDKANAAYKRLEDQLSDLGTRDAVRKDAPIAFKAANTVQQTSTKNKLYIGNRQYVSQHASGGLKKKRILDVPNWSPGLNVSWIEGGIAAKAHFKLKLKAGDQYADIPDTVLQQFKDVPGMSTDDFFKLCRTQGAGTLLWYNRDGASRPTWTALEIWCLLRAGYHFNFSDSGKDGKGRKIVLMPPQ